LAANLALRLLQVNFALIMVVDGLHKLQFGDWWAGLALWFPLHPRMEMKPGLAGSAAEAQVNLALLGLGTYAVLAWQIAFPVFAWRPRWRPLLIGGALIGWLGCAFLYRVPAFGPALLAGCLSYVSTAEWHRLGALLRKTPGWQRVAQRLPAKPKSLVPQGTR
jgi:hypothetical protein